MTRYHSRMTTMNDKSLKTAPCRPDVKIKWPGKVFTMAIAIAVLTATGPFGTYDEMMFPMRLTYWSAAVVGVGTIMNGIAYLSLSFPSIIGLSWPFRMLIWVLVGAIPGTIYMMLVGNLFLGLHVFEGSWLRLYFKLCMISSVICVLDLREFAFAGSGDESKELDTPEPYEAPVHHKFIHGLRSELGNDVISLSTQDHYLEVTTALGQDLVLGKMADAAERLAGLPGVRLHRSHFAAIKHIQRLRRRGSGYIVILSDGRELPVSRTYLPDVRAALGV